MVRPAPCYFTMRERGTLMRSLNEAVEFVNVCRDGVLLRAEDVVLEVVAGREPDIDSLVSAVTEFHLASSDLYEEIEAVMQ